MSETAMKNDLDDEFEDDLNDDLRPEYDLSELKNEVRGKYVHRYREGTNLVLLDTDVYEVFHDAESVNTALRMLIDLARKSAPGP